MQTKIAALAGGAVAIVGAALAGGYYYGRVQQTPPPSPPAQTTQQQSSGYAPPQQQRQYAQGEPAPMPQGYESASAGNSGQSGNSGQYGDRYASSGYSGQYGDRYSSRYSDRYAYGERHGSRHRINYSYFHDSLAPYGRWEYSDRWGQVWQPSYVDRGFRPYDRGHWVNTREYGWTWASDYEWGSIPFHYGRWVDDPERGWMWIPGYVWGPGWVVWRSNDRYTGWMPMPPDREFLRGDETYRNDWREQDVDYQYRDWYGPQYDQRRSASFWVFVDTGHVDDPDYHRYAISRPQDVQQVISQTSNVTNYTTVNNHVVNQSIDVRAVEQASGHRVEAVPAAAVIKKPELVTSVDEGRQTQIEARQEIPTGIGKPNSAPPPPPAQSNAQTGANTVNPPPTAPGGAPPPKGAPQNQASAPPATPAGAPPAPKGAAPNVASAPSQPAGPPGAPNTSSQPGSGTAGNGSPAETRFEAMRNRRLQREQRMGAGNGSMTGVPATNANPAPAPQHAAAPASAPAQQATVPNNAPPSNGTSPNAPSGTASNGPPTNNSAAQTPPNANPFAGPRGEALAGSHRHHPNNATPSEAAAPGGPSTANPTGSAANAGGAQPTSTATGEQQNPQFGGRHFRRQSGPNQTAGDQSPGAPSSGQPAGGGGTANDQAGTQGGFPRGAMVGQPSDQTNNPTNNTGGPPDRKGKHRFVVPAATEPGASHPNSEQTPASNAQSAQPAPDANGDNPRAKKNRHKNDEPGSGDESGGDGNQGGGAPP
jgi:hypothetical protein